MPPPLEELTLLDCRLVEPPESELGARLNTGSLVLLLRLLPDNTGCKNYRISEHLFHIMFISYLQHRVDLFHNS